MLALIGVRGGGRGSQIAEFKQRIILFPADNDNLGPAEMAEMAEIFPLFRYFSVSSVIDKDNSQSDWREDIFYNGRNGNYRKINGKGYVFRIK